MTDDGARAAPDDPEERTGTLIESLASDLAPVRPLPPLRWVVAALALVWALVGAVGIGWLGARPDLAEAWMGGRGVAAVFAALALAGGSGTAAAVAMSIPGRESLVRRCTWCAALSMGAAAGLGSVLFSRTPISVAPVSAHLHCLLVAVTMGLLPAMAVVVFAGRAAPFRPLVLAVAAAAAAASVGTVVSQAACPMPDMRHLLMGHVLAPVAGAALLTLPLVLVLRHFGAGDPAGD